MWVDGVLGRLLTGSCSGDFSLEQRSSVEHSPGTRPWKWALLRRDALV